MSCPPAKKIHPYTVGLHAGTYIQCPQTMTVCFKLFWDMSISCLLNKETHKLAINNQREEALHAPLWSNEAWPNSLPAAGAPHFGKTEVWASQLLSLGASGQLQRATSDLPNSSACLSLQTMNITTYLHCRTEFERMLTAIKCFILKRRIGLPHPSSAAYDEIDNSTHARTHARSPSQPHDHQITYHLATSQMWGLYCISNAQQQG